MPWLEAAVPVRMTRVALVAPEESLRDVLAQVADAGTVEIDDPGRGAGQPAAWAEADAQHGPGAGEPPEAAALARPGAADAARLLRAAGQEGVRPALAATAPDLAGLARAGRYDLLAGEAELQARAGVAVRRAGAAALAGWIPASRLPALAGRIREMGGALVPLAPPRGSQPPTLLGGPPLRRSLTPLIKTYGTVPYADIDPSWLAWASYVLMFGMMFGDVGQGLLLIAAAVALRAGWPRWARRWRAAWPFAGGAGLAATGFGLAYGEFFGPTAVVPTLWLNPLGQPIPLLAAAVAAGAVLLAGAYALGTVNRWREGGWPLALYAPSGVAGASLFGGLGVAALGWYLAAVPVLLLGAGIATLGLMLAFTGFFAEAGGRGTGLAQACVELFDLLIRLGSNLVSFARLAAFGLTHAALGLLVWDATAALWRRGGVLVVLAVIVFLAGNALAFALEALVAAIQALRLEYYELFSRVFELLGRPFRPWHVPAGDGPVPAGQVAAGRAEGVGVTCSPG